MAAVAHARVIAASPADVVATAAAIGLRLVQNVDARATAVRTIAPSLARPVPVSPVPGAIGRAAIGVLMTAAHRPRARTIGVLPKRGQVRRATNVRAATGIPGMAAATLGRLVAPVQPLETAPTVVQVDAATAPDIEPANDLAVRAAQITAQDSAPVRAPVNAATAVPMTVALAIAEARRRPISFEIAHRRRSSSPVFSLVRGSGSSEFDQIYTAPARISWFEPLRSSPISLDPEVRHRSQQCLQIAQSKDRHAAAKYGRRERGADERTSAVDSLSKVAGGELPWRLFDKLWSLHLAARLRNRAARVEMAA